jgi:peptide/nickel transport system substrate-binding protein
MRIAKQGFTAIAFAAMAAYLPLAGASSGQAQTLTIGVRGGPDSMDPHGSSLGTHAEAMKHVFETLVWSGDNLQLEPGLAESWRAVDETTWEFKLRRGVKFHDGSDLTAEDVKASIERIPGVGGAAPTSIYLKRVASTEIVDSHTIRVKTKGAAPALPADFNRVFIIPKAQAQAKTEDFTAGKAAIGTGPFRLSAWTPKGDLVLTRNDGYWRGRPHWERVIRREIPNDQARVAALKAGQLDLINYVPAADWKALQRDQKLKVFVGDSAYIFNLQLDQRPQSPKVTDAAGNVLPNNPLRDAKVREAIDLALNRKGMVEIVLEGLGKPARNIMAPGLFGDPADLPEKPHDLPKARALMAEAGQQAGFNVELHCTSDRFPGDGAVCQAIGQMLAPIGIRVKVNAISRTIFFPAHQKLEYSMSMNGWGTLTGEASFSLDTLIHSPDSARGLGGWNRNGYSRPDLDKLIVEASSELDDAKRRSMFEQALRITIADRAWLPVVLLQTVWAGQADKVVVTPRADEETLAYFVRPAR